MQNAWLRKDPMHAVLVALDAFLEAQTGIVAAMQAVLAGERLPLTEREMDELAQLAEMASMRVLAKRKQRRTWIVAATAGSIAAASVVVLGVVCFWAGQSTALQASRAIAGAPEWSALIANNDIRSAMATCNTQTFTDTTGAKACLLPLRLEPAKAPHR